MFFKGIKNKFPKAVYNRFVCCAKKIFYLICATPQLDIFCHNCVNFLEKLCKLCKKLCNCVNCEKLCNCVNFLMNEGRFLEGGRFHFLLSS